jgi:uncharacterized protein (DUF2235 family)
MPKKLVIFCDGTWNEPIQRGTNVLRLLQATASEDGNGCVQLVHYIAGVGTRKGEKFKGGILGYGISENIKDAYAFIVSNFEPGDEIYLFGFSRGAYTARSIAGLIHNFGVLKRFNLPLVSEAYKKYKDKSDAWKPSGEASKKFTQDYCHPWPVKIRFLGVWDTVGALGAPYGEILGYVVDKLVGTSFHDVQLSSSVDSACHALAADERRWPFRPTPIELTDYHKERNARNLAERGFALYAEKWFPGVHSDVGGGYEEYGLSDGALEWMAECASRNGLNVTPLSDVAYSADRPFRKDYTQPIHRSQTWYYQLLTRIFVKTLSLVYPSRDRPLAQHVTEEGDYVRPIGPHEDVSAVEAKRALDPDYRNGKDA